MVYQQNLRWRKNYYAKWTNSVSGVPTDSNLPPLALIIPDSFIVFLLTLQNLSIFHRFFFFTTYHWRVPSFLLSFAAYLLNKFILTTYLVPQFVWFYLSRCCCYHGTKCNKIYNLGKFSSSFLAPRLKW